MTAGPVGDLVVVRPRRLTRVCRVAAALLVVAFVVVAVSLGHGGDAQVFGLADQVAMVVLGLLLATGVLSLTRARVEADLTGIRVRNVLADRGYPWQVVRSVRLDDGQPWATLELQDDETVALLAVQTNDGERAVRDVLALRTLMRRSRG